MRANPASEGERRSLRRLSQLYGFTFITASVAALVAMGWAIGEKHPDWPLALLGLAAFMGLWMLGWLTMNPLL